MFLLKGDGLPEAQLAKYLYADGKRSADKNGFPVPVEKMKGSFSKGLQISLPAQSFVLLTNMKR